MNTKELLELINSADEADVSDTGYVRFWSDNALTGTANISLETTDEGEYLDENAWLLLEDSGLPVTWKSR